MQKKRDIRTEQIGVRVTPAEQEDFEAKSQAAGLSTPAWLRFLGKREPAPPKRRAAR